MRCASPNHNQQKEQTYTLFRKSPLKSSIRPKVDTCQWVQGAVLVLTVVGTSTWHLAVPSQKLLQLQRRQRWDRRRWEGRFLLEGPLGGSWGGLSAVKETWEPTRWNPWTLTALRIHV